MPTVSAHFRSLYDGDRAVLVHCSSLVALCLRGAGRCFGGDQQRRRQVCCDRLQLQPAGHRRRRPGLSPPTGRAPAPAGLTLPSARGSVPRSSASRRQKRRDERFAKLPAHRAVEDEVDGVVEQGGDVQHSVYRHTGRYRRTKHGKSLTSLQLLTLTLSS